MGTNWNIEQLFCSCDSLRGRQEILVLSLSFGAFSSIGTALSLARSQAQIRPCLFCDCDDASKPFLLAFPIINRRQLATVQMLSAVRIKELFTPHTLQWFWLLGGYLKCNIVRRGVITPVFEWNYSKSFAKPDFHGCYRPLGSSSSSGNNQNLKMVWLFFGCLANSTTFSGIWY